MFDPEKAADMALFIMGRLGGTAKRLQLMKLMYMAERESWIRYGCPMSGSDLSAMKEGPVLHGVYELVNEAHGDTRSWHDRIGYDKTAYAPKAPAGVASLETLSERDEAILASVVEKYGALDEAGISAMTHELPEWEEPTHKYVSIDFETILTRNTERPWAQADAGRVVASWEEHSRISQRVLGQ